MKTRFKDTGDRLFQYSDLLLVRCPRCEMCARVVLKEPRLQSDAKPRYSTLFEPRRLVCPHCGYTKEWNGKQAGSTEIATDFYFHLPLWLQTTCCSETLWALNPEHLAFLERYVAAELREGAGHGTMASKLPRWMTSAKNRDEVLHCISKLWETVRDEGYAHTPLKEETEA